MTLEKMKTVFASLSTCSTWSIQLLQIKNSKQHGISYSGREITLSPEGTLSAFVSEIAKNYITGTNGVIDSYQDVIEYDGSTIDKVIYWIKKDNDLISDEYKALFEAIATPDTEIDPLEFKARAYLLRGIIKIGNEEKPVKLISMQNPVTSLKHKFLRASGTFKKISDKVISLHTSIDVIMIDDTVYMLTLAGENLFNMKRAYKAVCKVKLQDIKQCSIVTDFNAFASIAENGHNPRKFVSFNDGYLQELKNANSRKKMAKKFNIPLCGDKFDTRQQGAADKIVKLLCNRGMIDPFNDNPMEVAGSKRWE